MGFSELVGTAIWENENSRRGNENPFAGHPGRVFSMARASRNRAIVGGEYQAMLRHAAETTIPRRVGFASCPTKIHAISLRTVGRELGLATFCPV